MSEPQKPRSLRRVKISLKQEEEAVQRAILSLCNKALGWHISFEEAEFEKISGGISNILVKVTPKPKAAADDDPSPPPPEARCGCLGARGARRRVGGALEPAVVKVFGDKTELLVDRRAEAKAVVALGAQGFGPRVLTLFANGRIEQFLHCATLTPQQMCDPRFIPRIAALLARFHSVQARLPRRPSTFPTIRRWLRMARRLKFASDDPKAAAYAALDFGAISAEVDAVEAACARAASPVVFGHNDLLSGNILILQRPGFDPAAPDLDGPLTVIDFEYGAYTHRGFDFGNHFNEYAGFECDYTRYPDREKQALFFSHYFGSPSGPAPLDAPRLERLCAEADVFALASHIYWGVWAVVQARYSPIDFDYMGYHKLRFDEYHRRKAEFMARAAAAFGGGGEAAAAAAAGQAAAA
ncbi:hypothetical protein Rsub_04279 [Raphidocelis subcapitata]|uniref:ethanolamine kinase n=1 Tax=Raphidocelis subcapitata TaxID=307507 RepID=A0A2V0NW34_9CHLO|nr:hypothetical protein Rsub_04279 [Raphidocelis subcapitata]|eukprot:GBF91539.1 hypothetical protein Rsub_04279 [Raphidocelis subcapitata]